MGCRGFWVAGFQVIGFRAEDFGFRVRIPKPCKVSGVRIGFRG